MQYKLFDKYIVAGLTDVGLVRQHNEDNILIDPALRLLLVADGMGGHQAGEVASMEAIKVIQRILQLQQREVIAGSWLNKVFSKVRKTPVDIKRKQADLESALHEANKQVYQLNVERNALNGTGMGTTVAGCWMITADVVLVFHVGDSRIYRLRGGQLQALSRDHSLYQSWVDGGCIGEQPPANVIVNAVGPYQHVNPEIQLIPVQSEDSFLLCSDGLTDMLDDSILEQMMLKLSGQTAEQCCQKMLEAALAAGGKDNVSIILMTQN